MLRKCIFYLSIFALVLGGCSLPTKSSNEDPSKSESTAKKEQVMDDFKAAEDVEGMLREGPGIYAGDEYNQKKVEKELDKFPKGISPEDAYNRLIYLLAEDYEPLVDEMKNLDKTYTLDRELPSGVGETGEKEGKQVNVVILLDASGSMNEKVSGGVKMDLAKQAIQQFAADLPEGTNVSLRVFGHKEGKSKKESCQSSETVYPLSSYDKSSFDTALNKFGAQGWTPLAKGIRDARNDLAQHASDGVENIVYVVSDGEETCGGDPVKEAKELHTSDMKAVVNIIGFDVSNREQRALKEVAKAGGGSYQSASSAKELEEQLRKERWRVEKEVIKWSSLSYDDLGKRHQELIEENGQLREQLTEMRNRESKNLSAAHRYLLRRIDSPSDLSIKINDRQQKISTYLNDLNDSSKKAIYEEYDKAYQELKKKKDEALNNE